MNTIHALTTLETEACKAQFLAQGFTLAPTPHAIIITGNQHSMSVPCHHLHHLEWDGANWLPIMEDVVEIEGKGWWTFNGVSAVERVA